MFFDAALLSLSLLEQCGNLDGQSRQIAIEYAPDDFINFFAADTPALRRGEERRPLNVERSKHS